MLQKLLILWFLLHQHRVRSEYEVPEYTDEDFDSQMANHDASMVMFYAPWCGHCKHLKPQYAKAAEILSENSPPVTLAKVDCTQSGKATCDKFKIDGYPTLKLFKNGVYHKDYSGPRTDDDIVDFMRTYAGTKYKQLDSVEDLVNFTEGGGGKGVRVVAYFDTDRHKDAFLEVVETLWERVDFAWSSTFHVEDEGLVMYRPQLLTNKFEDNEIRYPGTTELNPEKVKKFILKNYHGLAGIRTMDNRDDFSPPLVVTYYDVDYDKDPKRTKYWRNRVLKVAQNYKDKVTFAISAKHDFQDEVNEYGLDYYEIGKPVVIAVDGNKKKYVMEQSFSCENLTKFVDNMLGRKLEPKIKSEEVPLVNDGLIKVAVAKNFDSVVMENGRDTVVAFYAPWCGYCKKLAPVYEEFAKKMEHEEVVVVKMDATANDVGEEYKIESYPTVYWLKRDAKKQPVLYEGNKELDDMIKYVARHASEELKGFDREGNVKEADVTNKDEL